MTSPAQVEIRDIPLKALPIEPQRQVQIRVGRAGVLVEALSELRGSRRAWDLLVERSGDAGRDVDERCPGVNRLQGQPFRRG